MRIQKVVLPLFAVTSIGLAAAVTSGCAAHAEVKTAAAPPPPAPAPEPPPPPKPAPPKVALKGVQMKSDTKIDMPGDIEYASGSDKIVLNDKSKKILTQLVQILKDNAEITKLRIEGNTDNSGEDKGFDNMKLSRDRAQSIADYLTKNGVDAGRLVVVGYGSSHPLAANDTKEHMALNRYTDFVVQEFNGQAVEADGPPAGATAANAPKDAAPSKDATGKDAKAAPSKAPAAGAAATPAPASPSK